MEQHLPHVVDVRRAERSRPLRRRRCCAGLYIVRPPAAASNSRISVSGNLRMPAFMPHSPRPAPTGGKTASSTAWRRRTTPPAPAAVGFAAQGQRLPQRRRADLVHHRLITVIEIDDPGVTHRSQPLNPHHRRAPKVGLLLRCIADAQLVHRFWNRLFWPMINAWRVSISENNSSGCRV